MKLKKIISGLTSLALSFTAAAGMNFSKSDSTVITNAAEAVMKFDFGNGGTQSGYLGVSASDAYSSAKGYGFNTPSNMANVTAAGSGALSDAVQFKSTDESNTFNVDLSNGLYQVKVWLGNTTRTSIKAEGMLQLINMTGNNAYDTFQIPVTDGQLNIMATEGKAGYAFTMSALEIQKISDNPQTNPTIWICGDSTVCNYYPLDTSVQGGWGQMLNKFVDTSAYQVRNMAASGQYAKGFVDAGQFKPIEYYGKKGDYYIISIGINDTNYSNATEYYDVVTSMVKAAKAKGMEVILVKQQGRADDISRSSLLSGRWFGGTLDQIGSEQSVQVIDLFNLAQNYFLTLGQTATTALYMDGDTLHPNRAGAIKLAELVASQINFGSSSTLTGAVMNENANYMFKNVNSEQYMEVASGTAAAGTNVQQWGASSASAHNTWNLKSAADGYYYIYSMLGDGKTYYLDVDYGKADNGTNIGIYTSTAADAQLFKFVDNGDGTYTIVTKSSADKGAVEVIAASKESGANIQQWELNGNNCQKWYAEQVVYPPVVTTVTTTAPTTTEPTTAPTSGDSYSYLVRKAGDANCDGDVDMGDAVAILKYLADPIGCQLSAQGKLNGDVFNHGDDIDASDALEIQKSRARQAVLDDYQGLNLAVDAKYINAVTETVNEGYIKDAYINLENSLDSSIEWSVDVLQTGNYLVIFRFANGTTADRQMKVEVNGATDYWMQSFLDTGAWTTWVERGIVLPLTKGKNTITLTSATVNGGPNFDYLRVEFTDEPVAETYVPIEIPTNPAVENPVIYIAGDSTVQSYRESYAPQQGWGYYLANYFDGSVTVSNHAIAGRSSKSFYDNGRLDTILGTIKQGDYLFVQFGINDSASSNAERYAPVCGNVNNPTEGSFEFYMEKYISGALDKGATPVLVTTVIGLKAVSGGKFVNSYGTYCQAMKDMAAKYSIPCIDLNTLMVNHYNSIGYDSAYYYHLISTDLSDTDTTHFTETGANAVAGLVADAVKKLNVPISKNVK